MENTGCCPQFNPEGYENKEWHFENKLFLKSSIPTIFHIPIISAMNKMMTRIWNVAHNAGAVNEGEFLLLADDISNFRCDYYLAVNKEIENENMVRISGDFITKVFDGPYQNVPKWIKEMDKFLKLQNKKAKKYYFYYTTCPKCAKVYGHNYVVIFAKI